MPIRKGNNFEGRAKSQLLTPYLASKTLTRNFPTHAEAVAWEKRTRALLAAGILPEEIQSTEERITTIGEAIRQYVKATSLKATDEGDLMVVYVRIGATPLRDVNYDWVERWIADMKQSRQLAPSTIRKYVGSLRRCFNWLMRSEKSTLERNPLTLLPIGYSQYNGHDANVLAALGKEVKEDVARDRRLEKGEEARIRAVLAQKPRHEGLFFELALETAMRMSELYTLTVEQIDVARRTIFLDKTKNGDKRQVPLSSVAVQLCTELIEGRAASVPAFPWYGGKRDSKSEERTQRKRVTAQLSALFGRIFAAADCVDFHFHDVRHEATSRLFERTKLTDVQIAKITGHKSMEMLKRYANLRASTLADHLW